MWKQRSFISEETEGILYLVPTPIGNLEDITYRALHTLKAVSVIAAEDTRQTRKLLNHFEIDTKTVSYHEHNKQKSGEKLLGLLLNGEDIALVSDAGMPCISDPGYELVLKAIENKIKVIPLPGANAGVTALIAAGIPTDHFYFYGFLTKQKKTRKMELEKLKSFKDTIIFYESPHRLKETIKDLLDCFGDRRMTLCRELTKKFEEFIHGQISEILEWTEKGEIRGEFCMIVHGATEEEEIHNNSWWEELSIKQHVEFYIQTEELSAKESIKKVSKERELPKREVYHHFHIE